MLIGVASLCSVVKELEKATISCSLNPGNGVYLFTRLGRLVT